MNGNNVSRTLTGVEDVGEAGIYFNPPFVGVVVVLIFHMHYELL